MDWQTAETTLRTRHAGWWREMVQVIPELLAMEHVPQNPAYHPEGDVATHTRLAVEACPPDAAADLLWAVLLHDIGKPVTTEERGERITSHGHETLGEVMTREILGRFGLVSERIERIAWVVRHHTFHHAWQLTPGDQLTPRQKRFLLHPDFPLLLDLLHVDTVACGGRRQRRETVLFYDQLWREVQEEQG